MTNKNKILKDELLLAGAKQAELEGLLATAGQIKELRLRAKQRLKYRWRLVTSLGLSTALGVVVGATVIASAQSSLPGSIMYPAKRLSENMAVAIDPNYRATLMMRRSEEVSALVDERASARIVLATLAQYKTQAASYKTKNYSAYAYCKSNLEQALAFAPASERVAIDNTLKSLNDVD